MMRGLLCFSATYVHGGRRCLARFRAVLLSNLPPQTQVPRSKSGTDQRVSTEISIKSTAVGRRKECSGIKPFFRSAKNHWARECGVYKWAHRISRVSVVRRVVAELWREREARSSGARRPAPASAGRGVLPTASD